MSAYSSDGRVEIGLYEAWVASPDGPKYVFAGANRDDWVVGDASLSAEIRAADARKDDAFFQHVFATCPHFDSFDEAIRSLIGDPR